MDDVDDVSLLVTDLCDSISYHSLSIADQEYVWLVGLLFLINCLMCIRCFVLWCFFFFCLLSLLYYYKYFYQKVGLSAGGGDVVDLHNVIM